METLKPFFLNIPTLRELNVGTTDCMTNIQMIFDFFDTFGSMLWVTVAITSSLRAFSY